MPDWVIWLLFALVFAIALVALILAILWRKRSDSSVPHDPISINTLPVSLSAVNPLDGVFTPTNSAILLNSKISERQSDGKVNTINRIQASGIHLTPVSSDAALVELAFVLPVANVGTVIDNLQWLGTAVVGSNSVVPPLGIMQMPQISNASPTTYQFLLTWTFGGNLLPQDTTIELNLDISWSIITP